MSAVLAKILAKAPWRNSPQPPAHHEWSRPGEAELLQWSLTARPYNLAAANGSLILVAVVVGSIFYFSSKNEQSLPVSLFGLTMYFLLIYSVASAIHKPTNFSYRLTPYGIEECEWTELSKSMLLMAKGVAILAAIASVFMMALGPMAFLMSLGGAGGMGLIYAYMVNSESFREQNSSYNTEDFPWSCFTEIAVDRSRNVICLKYPFLHPAFDHELVGKFRVWCRKQDLDEIITVIRRQRPELPLVEEKTSFSL